MNILHRGIFIIDRFVKSAENLINFTPFYKPDYSLTDNSIKKLKAEISAYFLKIYGKDPF